MFLEPRHGVIDYAVLLEYNVSVALSHLLDIELESSKALGNGTNSLSFSNKITLLTDINIIDKKDKTKFEHFASIRNQFAHNKNVTDFTTCYKYLKDMDKKLRNLYGDKVDNTLSLEFQNEELFENLQDDISNILDKFIKSIFKKGYSIGLVEGNKLQLEKLIETINEFRNKTEVDSSILDNILKITKEKIIKELEE